MLFIPCLFLALSSPCLAKLLPVPGPSTAWTKMENFISTDEIAFDPKTSLLEFKLATTRPMQGDSEFYLEISLFTTSIDYNNTAYIGFLRTHYRIEDGVISSSFVGFDVHEGGYSWCEDKRVLKNQLARELRFDLTSEYAVVVNSTATASFTGCGYYKYWTELVKSDMVTHVRLKYYDLIFSNIASNITVKYRVVTKIDSSGVFGNFYLVDVNGRYTDRGNGLLMYNTRGNHYPYQRHSGTVCDDGFNNASAEVICRMMGYDGKISWNNHNLFPNNYRIALSDVRCSGRVLPSCTYSTSTSECEHCEDVYLTCKSLRRSCQNGFYWGNSSCMPCQHGLVGNGVVCSKCPDGSKPSESGLYCQKPAPQDGWIVVVERVTASLLLIGSVLGLIVVILKQFGIMKKCSEPVLVGGGVGTQHRPEEYEIPDLAADGWGNKDGTGMKLQVQAAYGSLWYNEKQHDVSNRDL